ncbi:hypothetical protein D3C73_753380 [compost metagenome]
MAQPPDIGFALQQPLGLVHPFNIIRMVELQPVPANHLLRRKADLQLGGRRYEAQRSIGQGEGNHRLVIFYK